MLPVFDAHSVVKPMARVALRDGRCQMPGDKHELKMRLKIALMLIAGISASRSGRRPPISRMVKQARHQKMKLSSTENGQGNKRGAE